MIWNVAYKPAAASAKTAAGVSTSVPGRTISSMPTNPAMTNAQRGLVKCSPSNHPAISVTRIGAVKLSAVASAMGRYFSAEKKHKPEHTSTHPRTT